MDIIFIFPILLIGWVITELGINITSLLFPYNDSIANNRALYRLKRALIVLLVLVLIPFSIKSYFTRIYSESIYIRDLLNSLNSPLNYMNSFYFSQIVLFITGIMIRLLGSWALIEILLGLISFWRSKNNQSKRKIFLRNKKIFILLLLVFFIWIIAIIISNFIGI